MLELDSLLELEVLEKFTFAILMSLPLVNKNDDKVLTKKVASVAFIASCFAPLFVMIEKI